MPDTSRSRIQAWIKDGRVRVDGADRKPSHELRGGERIEVEPAAPPPLKAVAEEIPLDVLYEDESVVAINKPAGMVVHAGAGVGGGTLTNALVARFQSLSSLGGEMRPGIVHRLDKDTSGVILVAKTDAAHRALAAQFLARTVEKRYLALVQGQMPQASGTVDRPITRDPVHRTRMTARTGAGRSALTYWEVIERLPAHTYLNVRIGTGRTHQIRVHLSSIGHPVAGDTLYGAARWEISRFFLHAHSITFKGPSGGGLVTVEAPLPAELLAVLDALRGSPVPLDRRLAQNRK